MPSSKYNLPSSYKTTTLGLILASVAIFIPHSKAQQQQASNTNGDVHVQLPLPWASENRLRESTRSYYIQYQLTIAGSNEILTFEEWAQYDNSMFRLDLVSDSVRTSYLTNGKTGETFRYKPFVCDQLQADERSSDLNTLARLFIGYPWSPMDVAANNKDKPTIVFGLGPLWLRARQDGNNLVYTKKPTDSSLNLNKGTQSSELDMYELELGQQLDHIKYKLRFYFSTAQYLHSVVWLQVDNKSSSTNNDEQLVQARVRVTRINFDNPTDDEQVFKLPIGFGCERRRDNGAPNKIEDTLLYPDYGLELLHQGAPNQVALELVTSRPLDEQMRSWASKHYSARIMRLSKVRADSESKTESYFVSLVQEQDGVKPMKRIKRVWWAPDSQSGQAIVYEIDQTRARSCSVRHDDVRKQLLLELPTSGGTKSNDENGEQLLWNANESVSNEPSLAALSIEQLAALFSSTTLDEYHLIDEGQTIARDKFLNRFYEKRVKQFELGSVKWPVSIVQRVSSYAQYLDKSLYDTKPRVENGSNNKLLQRKYRLSTTIFFYANEQFDKLLFKTTIDLTSNHEVDFAYAYEQIDVSECFEDTSKQSLVFKYPIESTALANQLEARQDALKLQLYLNLFQHKQLALTPLQVSKLQVGVDPIFMRVELQLVAVPASHLFEVKENTKLTFKSNQSSSKDLRSGGVLNNALIETSASNADRCADHCEHYNCLRFSFDQDLRLCTVELERIGSDTSESKTSTLFTYFKRINHANDDSTRDERPYFNLNSLIELFDEYVTKSSGHLDEDDFNPLVINLNAADGEMGDITDDKSVHVVELRPSSMEHKMDSIREYARELDNLDNDLSGSASQQLGEKPVSVRQTGGAELQLQYNILLYDTLFKDSIDSDSKNDDDSSMLQLTFEQCRAKCENQDCRSFSYCYSDESCKITWQHNEKFIRSLTRPAPLGSSCHVYALDYLSKFESYGLAQLPPPPPDNLLRTHSDALRPSDCANVCMDEQSFKCQGFYFCKVTTSAFVCHLIDTHISSAGDIHRRQLRAQTSQQSIQSSECLFYSRSYLAQFDKYFGKTLQLTRAAPLNPGDSLTLRSSTNVEDCARRCIELSCLAFDSCAVQSMQKSGKRVFGAIGKHTCQLAFKSFEATHLERNKRCTTFVLSDKSHFKDKRTKVKLVEWNANEAQEVNANRAAEIKRLPGGSLQTNYNEPELNLLLGETKNNIDDDDDDNLAQIQLMQSHWLAKLVSLLLGVCVGVALTLVWNEAYARGWLARSVFGKWLSHSNNNTGSNIRARRMPTLEER